MQEPWVVYSSPANNGNSWTEMNSGLSGYNLNLNTIAPGESCIFAGTQYNGVWKRLLTDKYLNVSSNSLSVEAAGNSTASFNITSNTDWTISSSETWLTPGPDAGSLDGTIILTAQANTITATRTAIVTVSGIDVLSKMITVTQQGVPTAVEEPENAIGIKIFPNPVNNTLLLNGITQETKVSIYDFMGNLILFNQPIGNQIDVSNLKNGIYTIKFENKTGIVIRRFIKQ